MDQLKSYADARLIAGCIYCGGATESRDHVPLSRPARRAVSRKSSGGSRLPRAANRGYSLDEEYFRVPRRMCAHRRRRIGAGAPKNRSHSARKSHPSQKGFPGASRLRPWQARTFPFLVETGASAKCGTQARQRTRRLRSQRSPSRFSVAYPHYGPLNVARSGRA